MLIDTSQRYETPTLAVAFNVWVDIHAAMEVVWRFLTDERDLARWWCSSATAESRAGGRLHFVWRGDHELTGDAVFRAFEFPNYLVIEWTHENGEPVVCHGEGRRGMQWPPLNIYRLAMINGNTTRVHLHDMGLSGHPRYAALVQATAEGWRESLTRLKRAVESRRREEATAEVRKNRRPAGPSGD